MSNQPPMHSRPRLENARVAVRSPRAAAVAGIIFAILTTLTIILIRVTIPVDLADSDVSWLNQDLSAISLALSFVPFAGIAFLWFIGVVRDRLGANEDQFFSTVFFGSGLLFLGLLFIIAALTGGLLTAYKIAPEDMSQSSVAILSAMTIHTLMSVYAVRMAGVFMISLGTLWYRTRVMPRPFIFLTYILAAVLLLTYAASAWLILILPLWVFVVSIYILWASFRGESPASETPPAEVIS